MSNPRPARRKPAPVTTTQVPPWAMSDILARAEGDASRIEFLPPGPGVLAEVVVWNGPARPVRRSRGAR